MFVRRSIAKSFAIPLLLGSSFLIAGCAEQEPTEPTAAELAEEAAKQKELEDYAASLRDGIDVNADPRSSSEGSTNQTTWAPEGFRTLSVSPDVAVKRTGHGKYEVTSRYDCKSLYVEVNFLDDSGAVVDWDNDLARMLSSDQIAKLEFFTSESSASALEFTMATCS